MNWLSLRRSSRQGRRLRAVLTTRSCIVLLNGKTGHTRCSSWMFQSTRFSRVQRWMFPFAPSPLLMLHHPSDDQALARPRHDQSFLAIGTYNPRTHGFWKTSSNNSATLLREWVKSYLGVRFVDLLSLMKPAALILRNNKLNPSSLPCPSPSPLLTLSLLTWRRNLCFTDYKFISNRVRRCQASADLNPTCLLLVLKVHNAAMQWI